MSCPVTDKKFRSYAYGVSWVLFELDPAQPQQREYSSEKKKRRKKRQNHEPIESTEKDYPITNDVEGDRQYRRNKGSKRSQRLDTDDN